MWFKLKPFLALMLAVIGGVTGYGIANSQKTYSAEFSLPVEPFTYRMAESKVASVVELRQFAAASEKSEQPEFGLLETQLLNGKKVVDFESKPRLNKREWRDAPDWMLQKLADAETRRPEVSDSAILNGKFLDAVVRARASDPEEAVRLAQFAMDFFRYAVHGNALREHLVRWGPVARRELATISEQMTKTASLLDSLAQKIAAMQKLADRNKEIPQFSAPNSTGIQLQVDTLSILSPAQQIVAFESESIEAVARDREYRLDAAYLRLMISIADEFTPKLDAGQSPTSVSDEIVARVEQIAQSKADTDRFAVERALASVDVAMTDLQARWLSARTEPDVPVAKLKGIPGSIGLLLGVVIGLCLWLVVLLRRPIALAVRRLVQVPEMQ